MANGLINSILHRTIDSSIQLFYIVSRGGDIGPFVSPIFSTIDTVFFLLHLFERACITINDWGAVTLSHIRCERTDVPKARSAVPTFAKVGSTFPKQAPFGLYHRHC